MTDGFFPTEDGKPRRRVPRAAFINKNVDVQLIHGDMLAELDKMAENSIDAVVTDPPYHFGQIVKRFGKDSKKDRANQIKGPYGRHATGFMGKKWDGGDIAFQSETWAKVFRVMKPGAHIVAFGGPTGFHRMACAVEDAGFEVRNTLLELLSTDKAVARFLGSLSPEQLSAFMSTVDQSQFSGLLAWVFGSGFPKSHDASKAIDKAKGAKRTVKTGTKPGHENFVGRQDHPLNGGWDRPWASDPEAVDRYHSTFEPATELGKQWQGWGTALKPAAELIVLARKPLDGNVAQNLEKWGTGALNIDACRIAAEGGSPSIQRRAAGHPSNSSGPGKYGHTIKNRISKERYEEQRPGEKLGRWPANVIHDSSEEVLREFPQSEVGNPNKIGGGLGGIWNNGNGRPSGPSYADHGSAARFFYSAKADVDDRYGSKHPTVKPVDLIRWLTRLITPPKGRVLDPFAGSGTTAAACLIEGFHCTLIEKEDEYVTDIRRRLKGSL